MEGRKLDDIVKVFFIFGVTKGAKKDITNNQRARKVDVFNMRRLNFMF
jgi:hypothetical protein